MIDAFKTKKTASKKRGRASTGGAENGAKRGKKSNGTATTSSTPPAGAEFKPPSGNWEEEVVMIDACEGSEGSVVVFLTWKGGQKTQHPLVQVYKRCPQKMLKFYESHLFVPFPAFLRLSNQIPGSSRKTTIISKSPTIRPPLVASQNSLGSRTAQHVES